MAPEPDSGGTPSQNMVHLPESCLASSAYFKNLSEDEELSLMSQSASRGFSIKVEAPVIISLLVSFLDYPAASHGNNTIGPSLSIGLLRFLSIPKHVTGVTQSGVM